MIKVTNPNALFWKHPVEGIVTRGDKNGHLYIDEWPASAGPKPSQAEVIQWERDYKNQQKPKDDAAENIRQQALKDATFDLLIYLADKPALIAGMPQYLKDYVADGKTYIAQRDA